MDNEKYNRSNFWKYVQNRTPFAMITLSKDGMTEQEKLHVFLMLKNNIRKLGYGYIELKGGFAVNDVFAISEFSLMGLRMKESDVIKIGQSNLGFGPQESVLYCNGSDFLGYIITDSTEGAIGSHSEQFNYDVDQDALSIVQFAI